VGAVTGPRAAAQTGDPRAERDKVRQQAADIASQVDALRTDTASVNAALDALQANVAGVEAELASAQAAADQAAAAVQAAQVAEQEAAAKVAALQEVMRRIAVDSYVYAGRGTVTASHDVSLDTMASADHDLLRQALVGFKTSHDESVLSQLRAAERELASARQAAEAAAAAAEGQRAEVATRAADAQGALAQQQRFMNTVQARLDSKLSEAAALAALDRKFSAQLAAQERELAARVAGPRSSPPPSGSTTPRLKPATPVLTTTHGITVAASIADALGRMLDAATADGLRFTGSGYRDYNSQVALRRQNCGPTDYDIYDRPASECSPPTARPGYSMHEQGLAIDFAESGSVLISHTDEGWIWFNSHAAAYGFYNLDSEPWHWSTTGS
jgi:LAS superfamily LD-carboxypeptidase LdcB